MLINRVYTAEEVRAMSRLTPADPRSLLHPQRPTGGPVRDGSRPTFATVLSRLLRRSGVRRAAPGTI